MDILYIVGTGSKHGNIELRMSLRSICKYGGNLGRVIIAGYPPDWISDEAVKMIVPNKYQRKHQNIVHCIQEVVDKGLLQGEFLYSSDDHFYVKRVDFDHYPFYFKNTSLRKTAVPGEKHYGYRLSLKQTRDLLEQHKLPTVDFEQHCNTHMNADVVKVFRNLMDDSIKTERGCAPTSLIMNAWMSLPSGPKQVMKRSDIKIRLARNAAEIRQQIGDAECFSISDSAFSTPALAEFFKEEFPDPCKFEKRVC